MKLYMVSNLPTRISKQNRNTHIDRINNYDISISIPNFNPKLVNKAITRFFNDRNNYEIKRDGNQLKSFLLNNIQHLDHVHVLTLLHRCTKRNIALSDIFSWSVVLKLLNESNEGFDDQSIGTALYAMTLLPGTSTDNNGNYNSNSNSNRSDKNNSGVNDNNDNGSDNRKQDIDNINLTNAYLTIISKKLEKRISSGSSSSSRPCFLNGHSAAMALYGLHSHTLSAYSIDTNNNTNNNNNKYLRKVIKLLAILIDTSSSSGSSSICSENNDWLWTASEISSAIYGLQGITLDMLHSSSNEEVVTLLRAVSSRINASLQYLESAATSGVVMDTDASMHLDVDVDVDVDVDKRLVLNAKETGMLLYGLKNLNLESISQKTHQVGRGGNGGGGREGGVSVIEDLVAGVDHLLKLSRPFLDAQGLANSLVGIRGLHGCLLSQVLLARRRAWLLSHSSTLSEDHQEHQEHQEQEAALASTSLLSTSTPFNKKEKVRSRGRGSRYHASKQMKMKMTMTENELAAAFAAISRLNIQRTITDTASYPNPGFGSNPNRNSSSDVFVDMPDTKQMEILMMKSSLADALLQELLHYHPLSHTLSDTHPPIDTYLHSHHWRMSKGQNSKGVGIITSQTFSSCLMGLHALKSSNNNNNNNNNSGSEDSKQVGFVDEINGCKWQLNEKTNSMVAILMALYTGSSSSSSSSSSIASKVRRDLNARELGLCLRALNSIVVYPASVHPHQHQRTCIETEHERLSQTNPRIGRKLISLLTESCEYGSDVLEGHLLSLSQAASGFDKSNINTCTTSNPNADTTSTTAAIDDEVHRLTCQDLAMCMSGLVHLQGDHTDTHLLVEAISRRARLSLTHIHHHSNKNNNNDVYTCMTVKQFTSAVYGTLRLDYRRPETRDLVRQLLSRVPWMWGCDWIDMRMVTDPGGSSSSSSSSSSMSTDIEAEVMQSVGMLEEVERPGKGSPITVGEREYEETHVASREFLLETRALNLLLRKLSQALTTHELHDLLHDLPLYSPTTSSSSNVGVNATGAKIAQVLIEMQQQGQQQQKQNQQRAIPLLSLRTAIWRAFSINTGSSGINGDKSDIVATSRSTDISHISNASDASDASDATDATDAEIAITFESIPHYELLRHISRVSGRINQASAQAGWPLLVGFYLLYSQLDWAAGGLQWTV